MKINKNIFNKKSKDVLEHNSIVKGAMTLCLGLLIGVTGMSIADMHPAPLVTARYDGHTSTILTDSKVLNETINSSSKSVMTEIIHGLLISTYGNKFSGLAQKQYELLKVSAGNEQALSQELAMQGMTPQSYLDSLQNSYIIQDEIKKTYKPSESDIKQVYESMSNKYELEGVYITSLKGDAQQDKVSKDVLSEMKSGKTASNILKQHRVDGCVLSGIGLHNSPVINQISSDDYIQLSDAIQNAIKGKKQGDVVLGKDHNLGCFVIKINKIKDKGSLSQERKFIVNELKSDASQDLDNQTAFIKKLFKEHDVHSSNANLEKQLKEIMH